MMMLVFANAHTFNHLQSSLGIVAKNTTFIRRDLRACIRLEFDQFIRVCLVRPLFSNKHYVSFKRQALILCHFSQHRNTSCGRALVTIVAFFASVEALFAKFDLKKFVIKLCSFIIFKMPFLSVIPIMIKM